MVRLLRTVVALAVFVPAATAFSMVSRVPPSAYVVPTIQIATAGEPIRITPSEIGAKRSDNGLEVDPERLEAVVQRLAETYAAAPQPGRYELTPDGVLLTEGTPGRQLDEAATIDLITEALRGRSKGLKLPFADVAPPPPPAHAIVVKLSEFRLEFYEGTTLRKDYVVGVGKLDFPTPPGVYHVASKAKNPTWRNPGSRWSRGMPAYIPPGPRNPLGTRALRLDRDAIVIHGTPNPSSVGQRSSHGCVRMHRADVEELFELVPVGTPVFIVP